MKTFRVSHEKQMRKLALRIKVEFNGTKQGVAIQNCKRCAEKVWSWNAHCAAALCFLEDNHCVSGSLIVVSTVNEW